MVAPDWFDRNFSDWFFTKNIGLAAYLYLKSSKIHMWNNGGVIAFGIPNRSILIPHIIDFNNNSLTDAGELPAVIEVIQTNAEKSKGIAGLGIFCDWVDLKKNKSGMPIYLVYEAWTGNFGGHNSGCELWNQYVAPDGCLHLCNHGMAIFATVDGWDLVGTLDYIGGWEVYLSPVRPVGG